MQHLFANASRARIIDAAPGNLSFYALQFRAAHREGRREDDFLTSSRMLLVPDDFNDLRDDVAASLDLDGVSDSYSQSVNLVGVVQSSARNRGPPDQYRRQDGDWGNLAGSTDLKVDVSQLCCCCAGGELVGNCPSRRFAGKSKAALSDWICLSWPKAGFGLAPKLGGI